METEPGTTQPPVPGSLPDHVKDLLRDYFPDVDLDRVRVHHTLPWIARFAPISVRAMALGKDIYFDGNFDPVSADGIATIGHELVHVSQWRRTGGFFVGPVSFAVMYVWEYAFNRLRGMSRYDAYGAIRFEQEAGRFRHAVPVAAQQASGPLHCFPVGACRLEARRKRSHELEGSMNRLDYSERYGGNAAENYEKYFVPAIGRPSAAGLIEAAELESGEAVLDVACGTGVVARLAREALGAEGIVTGLDVNLGMLSVARAATPEDMDIEWIQAPAEDMPLPDDSFDVVLCGMGLQFFEDREAGLREMRRVLSDDGRAVFNLPGPIPPVFQVFERGLDRHLGPEAAGFAAAVFSLHDADEIRELTNRAGFGDVRVDSMVGALPVGPPEEFLWQYVHSTPLAGALEAIGKDHRDALEREVVDGWGEFVQDGSLVVEVRMTTVVAKP